DQLKNVITRLKMDLQSRRAFATIYNPVIDSCCMQTNDFPCTIGYQFLIRNNKLDMICFMRSQSVLFVMPYDVFINTMLQEYMAKRLGVEIGNYYHTGGSFHFFENETKFAEKIIEADYIIPENFSMPKMYDNVLDGLNHVLEHETLIRESAVAGSYIHLPDDHADEYGKYWGDIIRLLEIYAIDKIEKDISEHIRKTYERKVLIKKLHPTYQAALEILE
ncbi:MAG: thymidylate synthase, partial [SAR202 cluster bacterium]|nr:thymidylate synthase [SAR202 cluster bacterium]